MGTPDNHKEDCVSSRGPLVAVADAASVPGGRVLSALVGTARRQRWATPVAIAPARGEVTGAQWRLSACDNPLLARYLTGVDTLVWVADSADLQTTLAEPPSRRRDRVTRTAHSIITAAVAAGVPRLVVVTSAMVLGARRDNPLPLPEDAPRRAEPGDGVLGDLLVVEEQLEQARNQFPGLAITVVRPAALVGPGIDTVVTRHFEAPRLLTIKGAEPAWQFCHVDDLASSVALVVRAGLELGPGRDAAPTGPLAALAQAPAVAVGCPGWLSQEQVERLSAMRRVQLSHATALGTAQRLHRVGLLPAPASELALTTYPWVIDPALLEAAGWTAAYDNETCLGVLLETIRGCSAVAARRIDRKDAAFGAASAAVALIGTAAAVRRSRRR
ncbi:MAG: NAD-dependent dehydratase [Actinomycetales bacterium]|nr:MAG: NAD-dependent dehydratase [Actinomycetales bacterium]